MVLPECVVSYRLTLLLFLLLPHFRLLLLTCVQFAGGKVRRRADDLDAAMVRTVIWAPTLQAHSSDMTTAGVRFGH